MYVFIICIRSSSVPIRTRNMRFLCPLLSCTFSMHVRILKKSSKSIYSLSWESEFVFFSYFELVCKGRSLKKRRYFMEVNLSFGLSYAFIFNFRMMRPIHFTSCLTTHIRYWRFLSLSTPPPDIRQLFSNYKNIVFCIYTSCYDFPFERDLLTL